MSDDYAPITDRLARLGFSGLAEFHQSELWRQRRELWRRDHPAYWQCFVCGAREGLQLHHVSYERLGAERDEDLLALCDWHHTELHDLHATAGVPLAIAHLVLADAWHDNRPVQATDGLGWLDAELERPWLGWDPVPSYRWVPAAPAWAWTDLGPTYERVAFPWRRAPSCRAIARRALLLVVLLVLGLAVHGLFATEDDSDVSAAFWACVIVVALVHRWEGRGPARRWRHGRGPETGVLADLPVRWRSPRCP